MSKYQQLDQKTENSTEYSLFRKPKDRTYNIINLMIEQIISQIRKLTHITVVYYLWIGDHMLVLHKFTLTRFMVAGYLKKEKSVLFLLSFTCCT